MNTLFSVRIINGTVFSSPVFSEAVGRRGVLGLLGVTDG